MIGAGPAGLAVAGAAQARGITTTVFEGAPNLARTWRSAYDRLHLNTMRSQSHLPGARMPRGFGRFPGREDYVAYLEQYASDRRLDIRLGVPVETIQRDGHAWTLTTPDGPQRACQVVVATGYNAAPVLPAWASDHDFEGLLLHSSQYRTGAPFAGKRALVVGLGNSGAEIARDLVEHQAATVAIAVRSPRHIVPRQHLGVPAQLVGIAIRPLPPKLADLVIDLASRLSLGRLQHHGLQPPTEGAIARLRRDGVEPTLDSGFIQAVKRRHIEVVPAVSALNPQGALLTDGRTHDAEVIVAATGFRTNLQTLVGHLEVLDERGIPIVSGEATDPRYPGLRFIGFSTPIGGILRELRHDARRIARAVQRDATLDTAPAPAASSCRWLPRTKRWRSPQRAPSRGPT